MISPMLLFGFAVAAVAYILNYCISQLNKYKDINKLPGPNALEVLKQTLGRGSNYDKYNFVSSLNKKYGPVVKLWIKPFDPVIMVADIDYFDKILMSRSHLTKTSMYDLLKPYIGNGIATINKVDVWKKDRKICNTAFQHSTITGFIPLFAKYTDKFLEILKEHTGKVVDTQPLIHLYTLDIVFESMTTQGQDFQENKNLSYLNARVNYFKILAERLYSAVLANNYFFKFSPLFKEMDHDVNALKEYTRNIIKNVESNKDDGSNSKLHLIDILFANNIEGEALNDQINTFILAGHDTVAQAMSFTLYELARHPDAQRRLYEEIISIVGKDKNLEITNNDLQQMKYLDAVVRESMRLHTIVPIIERKLTEDLRMDGINYPAGTAFMLRLSGVHESEKYYKNPQKFEPDRFMPENASILHKNSFTTFSFGPRDCIGKYYAMLEIKFFIAKLLQKFEVRCVENHQLKFVNEIIIKSITGVPVIFEERK